MQVLDPERRDVTVRHEVDFESGQEDGEQGVDQRHIMLESRDNVKVAIRIRPLNVRELRELDDRKCVTANLAQNSVSIDLKPEPRLFTYDFVADEDASQDQVFEAVGAPVATACLSGYNCTIFAYGQTGAGKTYTILGPDLGTSFIGPEHDLRGLLPRCAEYLFSSISREAHEGELEFLVKCSYLEIYQETIIDLLDPSAEARALQLHEDIKRGVYVEGLVEETIMGVSQAYEIILSGNRNRHVAATSMNKESSRSHTVFTIILESKDTRTGVLNFRSSRFHLIDLAGSERQKATDAAGERLKEAGKINKSLSALGNVINSLVDIAEGKNRHVHYRDSKLTFLLKDSLGGNAKTLIIANISPAAASFGETLSTLKFVQRAKQIRNKAVINEDTSGTVEVLKEELRRVKEMLERSKGRCERCRNKGGDEGGDKKRKELEMLLEHNLHLRQSTESLLQAEILKRDHRVTSLESLISKFEQRLSHSNALIKLKDLHLHHPLTPSEDLARLESEIALLHEIIETNPEADKLKTENDDMKRKIEEMMAEGKHDPSSIIYFVKENQDFTQELADTLSDTAKEREDLKALIGKYQKEGNTEQIGELKAMYEERIMTLNEKLDAERREKEEIAEKLTRKIELQARRIESLSAKLAASDVPFSPFNVDGSFDLLDAFTPPRRSLLTPLSPIGAGGTLDFQMDSGRIATLEIQIAELKDALETKESELRESREELEVMNAAGEFIKRQVHECSLRAEEKTIQNAALLKELKEVQAEAAAQAELLRTSKEDALKIALSENETLRKEKGGLEVKVADRNANISGLEDRIKDLTHELEIATAQERLSNTAIIDLQKKVLGLTQSLTEKSENLEAALAELQFYQQENKHLSAIQTELPNSFEGLRRENEDLKSRSTDEIAQLRSKQSELEDQIATQHRTIETLKSQLSTLRSSLFQAQTLNKTLTQTISGLRTEMTNTRFPAVDPQIVTEELDYLREENRALKDEIRVKMEILSNTNRNILATRSEIEMWKVSIEDKNTAIRTLKGELKDKEASISVVQQTCAEELSDLRAALTTRELEIKALKDNSTKRLKQAEMMLEKQRKEVEFIAKQSDLMRTDLDKTKSELETALREKEALQRRDRKHSRSPGKAVMAGDKTREEVRNLNSGLTKITEFVFSLPIIRYNPEETDLIEGTIRAIATLYDTLETRELELSEKDRELQRKTAKLSLLENERMLWRQRMDLSRS